MSRIEKSRIYDISFASHEASLEGLGKELSRALLSDKDLANAAARLEKLRGAIQSHESKDRLVSCYGRIHTLTTNNLVDRIVDHTFSLVEHKDGMSQEEVEKKTEVIENEVAHLWHDHALSAFNRRFIKMVVSQLNALRSLFPSQVTDAQNKNENDASSILTIEQAPDCSQSSHVASHVGVESPDVAFELCEIARDFYHHHIGEGMKKLRELAVTQKGRLYELAEQFDREILSSSLKTTLKKNYTSQATDLNLAQRPQHSQCSPHMMRFIQVLISYSHEIAQGDGVMFYPSESEIHMMFQEVEQFYEK